MATKPYYRDGLRQLATLLPTDDAELHEWLAGAAAAHDENSFTMLFAAASISGRKLRASLLRATLLMRISAWHIAWTAWRMEGEVTEELLEVLGTVPTDSERRALLLFVAAAWWKEHRPGEEPPKQIVHLANEVAKEGKPSAMTVVFLQDIGILLGGEALLARASAGLRKQLTPKMQEEQLGKMFALLNGSFDQFIYEQPCYDYSASLPKRRAVERIGRNDKCPCGSGKKYKQCCESADRERLRNSSWMPGMTIKELHNVENDVLTKERLETIGPAQLVKVDPLRVPTELQGSFIFSLARLNQYDEAIAAFRKLAVCEKERISLPEHLHQAWSAMFEQAAQAWRPDVARRLVEVFPDAEEKLGQKANAAIRLLLIGDDPAQFAETLEKELRMAFTSDDSLELQRIVWTVIESPYRALGIMLARSVLPIAEEKFVPGLFEGILAARAKLNLSPDDEFSDFMDERALRAGRGNESAATQEAQDKLAAKAEELRRAKEERAHLERELKQQKRQERRAEAKSAATPDSEAQRSIRELKSKIDRLNALVAEGVKERVALRRDAQAKTEENEALKAASSGSQTDDTDADQTLEISGTQPVRLIEFPKEFAETLASFPRHVGRAAMNRLGRIASGEPGAFERVKQLKAYPEVLRARVADKYRLLFSLTPECVRVVDLIRRADLDRRIERLLQQK